MHTVWKGSISFGLVNIPVRMFTATEDRDIRFRQLHKECHTPIRYSKVCPTCDREVASDEIIKGYEYEKGNFVMIQDEDLDKIAPETKRAIEIVDFVQLSEIDPIYFDKSYYLSPQETGEKAYSLLRVALQQTGKIAIARITLRNKESLAVLRIYQNGMVLETIFYPDEVRSLAQVPALPQADAPLVESELAMAIQLVESMSRPFHPEQYQDTYRQHLQELITKKLEGKEVATAPSAPRANVIDLMQALKESLAQAEAPQELATKETNENRDIVERYPEPRPIAQNPKKKSKASTTAATTKLTPDTSTTSVTKALRRKKTQTPNAKS
ncbi:Ku protein [Brevibacillus sp. 7WMA2]|uniref:Non-homologous end joining protein Ku n=1 Tax=Brevibacillus laterosporus LMG 15441 TaxID=1042163 RepID=A0A075R754_BRELA|nr:MULTISPECIES: Ku protein [Brevibacillus]WPS86626.1 Ku protein [Brevibacillus halotolerans]AIG27669.1 putative DNA repair protein YkoV [Brevibacillus laterosporus LMG 15441]AYK09025.1 Ku protein [Brevibacillus laterosporus]ERM19433.1 DNA repair protein [Brevibacillus laterosporus PE36]MCR8994925.1 Ku protein [Brevibacillus laterosporus]